LNGEILVKSVLGSGSKFIFEFTAQNGA